MTSMLLHSDFDVSLNLSHSARWLQGDQVRVVRYMTTFGTGSRQFMGMKYLQNPRGTVYS